MIKIIMLTERQLNRFWSRVNKTDTCWNWVGYINKDGHGRFCFNRFTYFAHRVSFFIQYGEIPNDMCILHKPQICHNSACVNPQHLYADTISQNNKDKIIDGTSLLGELNPQHKLNEKQVIEIRTKYKTGKYSHRFLATEYNVSRRLIACIINRIVWKHI